MEKTGFKKKNREEKRKPLSRDWFIKKGVFFFFFGQIIVKTFEDLVSMIAQEAKVLLPA